MFKIKNDYRIKKGDTLGSIAKNNNMSTDVLAQMNKIKNPNKIKSGDNLSLKAKSLDPLKSTGLADLKLNNKSSSELAPSVLSETESSSSDSSSGFGAEKALGVASGLMSLAQNNKPELDTSGNTDYTGVKGSDVGAGGMDIAKDTLSMAATGMQVGGPIGAAVGGVLGLGKGIIGNNKQKRKLAQAKERFQSKKRYQSEKAIDKISNSEKTNDILGEDNINYIENLKNSPSYNRFKRNSQYTI